MADRRHADEVGRTRQETGEGATGTESRRARRGPCHADHHLLGDEAFEEAIRRCRSELVAEGRVLHVGVERDDPRIDLAEFVQRLTVRFAGGHFLAPIAYGGHCTGGLGTAGVAR